MSCEDIPYHATDGVVKNAQLREWLAETIVKRHFGRALPDDTLPVTRGLGTLGYRWGAWFAVTESEVHAARLRAFRAGVTYSTYTDFHLLRRNYEADPTPLRRGIWFKVQRDPPLVLPRALTLFWTQSGISLIALADQLDRIDPDNVAEPDEMRVLIRSIFADMCRPLAPRR